MTQATKTTRTTRPRVLAKRRGLHRANWKLQKLQRVFTIDGFDMNSWVMITQEMSMKELVKDTSQLDQKNLAATGKRMF